MKAFLAAMLFASALGAQIIQVSDSSIGPAGRSAANPFVATNGQTSVIAWQENASFVIGRFDRSGAMQTETVAANIPFVRGLVPVANGFVLLYTSDGNWALPLDAHGEIAGEPHRVFDRYSSVGASNGDRVLDVNEAGEGVILSPAANVIVDNLRLSTAEPYTTSAWAAAATHDRFLYAEWTRNGEIRATVLDWDGRTQSSGIVVPNAPVASGFAAASDGERFVILWRSGEAIRAWSESGSVVTLARASTYGSLDVAWSGSEYVALVNETSSIRRLRFSRDLVPSSDEVIVSDPAIDYGSQRLAIAAGTTIATWRESPRCGSGYGALKVSLNGGDARPVALGTATHLQPVIAANAASALVVWNEARDFVRKRAAVLDPFPRPIDVLPDAAVNAAVATDGSGYLIAYLTPASDCTNVLQIETVDAGGGVVVRRQLGPSTMWSSGVYPAALFPPAVAWNGAHYLVAWMQRNEIVGVRVSPTGNIIDAVPITLARSAENGNLTPRLVWINDAWELMWWRSFLPMIPWYPGPPTENVVWLQRLTRELQPIGNPTVLLSRGWEPAIATDGARLLLAWRDGPSLHAGLVSASGALQRTATRAQYREYGTTLSAAAIDGMFYVLDVDRLYAYDGASFTEALRLPGNVSTSAMAVRGSELVLTWASDGTVYSTTVAPTQWRRRAVR